MMSTKNTTWEITNIRKRQYLTIWRVNRYVQRRRQIGYFKFPNQGSYKYIGPLFANELICYQLANKLQLPVAKTIVTTVRGRMGIISLEKQVPHLHRWLSVMKHKNALRQLIRPKELYKTFVFDSWICNIDRSDKNIMVYPKATKYDFYLIDHELALLGASRYEEKPWNSTYWDNMCTCTDGYHPALLKYIKNYTDLAPYVRQIQKLSPKIIYSIVASVPSTFLSRSDKTQIVKLLLYRQRRLHFIVSNSIPK